MRFHRWLLMKLGGGTWAGGSPPPSPQRKGPSAEACEWMSLPSRERELLELPDFPDFPNTNEFFVPTPVPTLLPPMWEKKLLLTLDAERQRHEAAMSAMTNAQREEARNAAEQVNTNRPCLPTRTRPQPSTPLQLYLSIPLQPCYPATLTPPPPSPQP